MRKQGLSISRRVRLLQPGPGQVLLWGRQAGISHAVQHSQGRPANRALVLSLSEYLRTAYRARLSASAWGPCGSHALGDSVSLTVTERPEPDTQKPLTVLGRTLSEVWWSFPGTWRQEDEEFKIRSSELNDIFTLRESLATKQNHL